MTPLVALDRVSVRLGRVVALRDVSLRVSAGERVALVGANGSGKSTLVRLLHGLCVPTQGRRTASAGLRQAMVFQRPYVMRASALWNVRLALWLAGVRGAEATGRAREALAAVGLEPQAQRRATELSGGQQQRLALARAWAVRPDMLLLDEPTASLDPTAKREVEALIAGYAGQGMTLVLASHNLGQVKRLATRVVCLGQGRVLADLPVAEFFDARHLAAVSQEALAFVQGEG